MNTFHTQTTPSIDLGNYPSLHRFKVFGCTALKSLDHLYSINVHHLLVYRSRAVFKSLVKSFKRWESRRSDLECLSKYILMQRLFLITWLFWLGLVMNRAQRKRSGYTIKKECHHNPSHAVPIECQFQHHRHTSALPSLITLKKMLASLLGSSQTFQSLPHNCCLISGTHPCAAFSQDKIHNPKAGHLRTHRLQWKSCSGLARTCGHSDVQWKIWVLFFHRHWSLNLTLPTCPCFYLQSSLKSTKETSQFEKPCSILNY